MDLSPTVSGCVYAGIDLRSLLHEVRRMTCFLFNYANIVYPKRKVKRFLLTFPFSFADGLSGTHRVLFPKIRCSVLQTPAACIKRPDPGSKLAHDLDGIHRDLQFLIGRDQIDLDLGVI